MTLQEAIKTGRPFTRRNYGWLIVVPDMQGRHIEHMGGILKSLFSPSVDDVEATDWMVMNLDQVA